MAKVMSESAEIGMRLSLARRVQLRNWLPPRRVHRRPARRAALVVLDGTLTDEFEAEGWAKDRIRELQDLRKSSGHDVSDRIAVVMSVPPRAETGRRCTEI